MNELRHILVGIRKQRQMTQQQVADAMGVPVSSVAHFETGERRPSHANFIKLSNALGVSMDYLAGRSEVSGHFGSEKSELLEAYDSVSRKSQLILLDIAKTLKNGGH